MSEDTYHKLLAQVPLFEGLDKYDVTLVSLRDGVDLSTS